MGVVGKQHQRCQTGRTNRIALGHRFGGVAHGVEWVGHIAHAAGQFGHFGNATGVVGDGAISVQRHHNARHAQHGGSRCGHAIQTGQTIRRHNRHAHRQHRPSGGLHRDANARNDVGCVSRGRRLRHVLHRCVVGTGVVLGDPHQRGGQHQAHSASAKQAHLRASTQSVIGNHGFGHEKERDQAQHTGDHQTFVQGGHDILHARRRLHKEATHDGRQNRHATQHQGVEHRLHGGRSHHQGAEHHGGDQGHRIGFKQVSGHACAVAHVVTHVVGNHSWVARVVFGNTGFHLAHQISAHISAFGENAATQTRKNRNQRRAKRQTNQRVEQLGQVFVRRVIAIAHQEPIETSHTQEPQAHHQHASDGAALERNIQRRANALRGGLCGAYIGANRHIHPNEAACAGEHSANDETKRRGLT